MLVIAPRELAALRAHAEQEYPRECCGILLGRIQGDERRVEQVVRCRNTRPEQSRYAIAPADLIEAQKSARAAGMEILGFYHSHPDHAAQPSPADLEEAHWPERRYVIVSVQQGKAGETRSFCLRVVDGVKEFVAEALG